MRRVIIVSGLTLLALVVVVGGGAAYLLMAKQDRGLTRDGRMAPPASVRNAPECLNSTRRNQACPRKRPNRPTCSSFRPNSKCRLIWIFKHRKYPLVLGSPPMGRLKCLVLDASIMRPFVAGRRKPASASLNQAFSREFSGPGASIRYGPLSKMRYHMTLERRTLRGRRIGTQSRTDDSSCDSQPSYLETSCAGEFARLSH